MKKHLSVFGLYARSSIFKVIGILLLMCAVEIAFFHIELQDTLKAYEIAGSDIATLERIFMRAATNVYFRVALVLITVVICLPGCKFKTNTSYTLRRLSISERATFFNQAAYNALVYMMLFAVQLLVAFGLSQYYLSVVPEECISNQTIFLAFYRNTFLHSLLPLEDIGLWIRNGLLVITFGLATAEFPYRQRRHKFSLTALALVIYTICWFDQGIGQIGHVITTAIIALMLVGTTIYTLAKKDEEVVENE